MTIMCMPVNAAAAVCLSLVLAGPTLAQTIKSGKDVTRIEVQGQKISMLRTTIDTNNAHPIETISFFIPNNKGAATQIAFDQDGDYAPLLTMKSGADCAISAVHVLLQRAKLQVIYASRKGEWNDQQIATLSIFELAKNAEGAPGVPDLYFKKLKTTSTRHKYCDVNDALDKESNLYK